MAKITNSIILHDGHAEIIAENSNYRHSVLLDKEDIVKVGKVRISNTGYAYTCIGGLSVSSLVMGHKSNTETVVDHINGNRLDNRKTNLRIVTQRENSRNKSRFIRNNTGVIGISYRENGRYSYYRVSLTDPNSVLGDNRQGRRIVKQFNINRLGKQRAFEEAQAFLAKAKLDVGY